LGRGPGIGNSVPAACARPDLADIAAVGLAFLYELEHGKPTVRMDKVIAVLGALGLELEVGYGRRGVVADIAEVVP